jgi:translation initiation factor 2 alpha subunit (eIF-2alpha)
MFYKQSTLVNDMPPLDTYCFVKLSTKYNIKPNDLGLYVNLVDYNMMEAYIPLSELTKWKVNIQKIFKYDKVYPCIVHNIDKTNKFINLSYIKIKEPERERLMEQFNFAERIHNICEIVNTEIVNKDGSKKYKLIEQYMFDDKSVEELYTNILENPIKYFGEEHGKIIESRIKIELYESMKEFQLIICQENGLNKLKNVLNNFQTYLNENNISGFIECVSSPIYCIRLKHDKLEEGYFSEIFQKFQEIIDSVNTKAIFNELELKTYKQKRYDFN